MTRCETVRLDALWSPVVWSTAAERACTQGEGAHCFLGLESITMALLAALERG